MSVYVGYEVATGCVGGAASGAKELMSWYLGAYEDRENPRAANLGIYTCKRLGSGWSIHAEGRACDLGTARYSKPPWGWTLAEKLRQHSRELGIQCIIFDRKIWSGSFPHDGWREYSGSNPHTGHIHVELSKLAARDLTVKTIQNTLSGGAKPQPVDWRKEIVSRMQYLDLSVVTSNGRTWLRGLDVGRLQSLLAANGFPPKKSFDSAGRPDRIAGPSTKSALGSFQRVNKTGRLSDPDAADYKAGKNTWGALAGV